MTENKQNKFKQYYSVDSSASTTIVTDDLAAASNSIPLGRVALRVYLP